MGRWKVESVDGGDTAFLPIESIKMFDAVFQSESDGGTWCDGGLEGGARWINQINTLRRITHYSLWCRKLE